MVGWDTVREIALAFPEVEESTESRTAFRVHGKLFAWAARERDGGGLAVRVAREEKQLILDSDPGVYFTSPHYDGWPGVQIRLEAIDPEELRMRLEDAWLIQAPKKLAAALRHRDRLMHDWDTVREIAGALPGAEESTTYGKPAFKVGGKLFAWISPDRHADDALAVRVDPGEKELLVAGGDAYFETPHYDGHPIVLIRLERISRAELEERIDDAWLLRAPKRLVDAYVDERS